MTVEQAITDISALSIDDQLRVVQAIWDHMPDDATTALSDAQRAELERREARYKSDPSSLLTETELREQVKAARS